MGGVNNPNQRHPANGAPSFGTPNSQGAQSYYAGSYPGQAPSYGGYNATNAFPQNPAMGGGYDTFSSPSTYGGYGTASAYPTYNAAYAPPQQADTNTSFVGGLNAQMAKATGGLSGAVQQALQADAIWKQQQAAAAQQQQQQQPPTGAEAQPQTDQPQPPTGGGYDAIDKIDFSKFEGMSEDDLKKAFKGLNIDKMTPDQKEYLVIKFIEALSKEQGDDKGLNKIADTLGIDHDDLTDDEFSAHDFHVIRDVLNEMTGVEHSDATENDTQGTDVLGNIVNNFAYENGASNRTYIALAVGSDSSGWWGHEYFQKGDFSKVLEQMKKGKTINDLIVDGRTKD